MEARLNAARRVLRGWREIGCCLVQVLWWGFLLSVLGMSA